MVFLPAALSRASLAWCHAELGTFAEGRVLGEEGLRMAEAVDHPGSLRRVSGGLGLLALRQGDLRRALPLLEWAVGLCQEANLPALFPEMAAALGAAYTLGEGLDMRPLQAHCHHGLGTLYATVGRPEQAQPARATASSLPCHGHDLLAAPGGGSAGAG
jgi:hypothetical protein